MTVDLPTLYRLIGVDEQDGPRELLYAAGLSHYTLRYLVLSAVEQTDGPMGPASADELARARGRAATYARIERELTATTGATVLKGSHLADLYPPGVLRAQGDVDLAFGEEAGLWRAVRWLLAEQPRADLKVTSFGRDPRHVMVSVSWDGADVLSDPEHRVELSTAALTGDFATVPIRATLPADPLVGALLGIAEERLQREFHTRDVLDMAVLGTVAFPPLPELLTTIEDYHLAPEASELLIRAAAGVDLGSLAELPAALAAAADRERERRRGVPPPPDGSAGTVQGRLAAGLPLYGMELRRVTGREGWTRTGLRSGDWGTILLTPVADYLLVATATVDPAEFERAIRGLDRLEVAEA